MWTGNDILCHDLEQVCEAEFIPWKQLVGKTILVTGATGLIGYTLVHTLVYANYKRNLGLTVLALVRDEQRARRRFAEILDAENSLRFIVGNVEDLPWIEESVNYIVHGASQTASIAFVQQPVESILIALRGTENVLELARVKNVDGFVYLSSMEVYGYPQRGHKVTEDEIGALSPLILRNSYPISKQQCESLCCAYAGEYGVPAMILRLTQTFGPGVDYDDGRIFAELMRCVIEERDIILKTTGMTERSYLYTADAATAILTVLLKGGQSQAYTAANSVTYCSILEMAKIVADKVARRKIQVRIESQDTKNAGYADTLYMKLDTSKLEALGWKPTVRLEDMFERMIGGFEQR